MAFAGAQSARHAAAVITAELGAGAIVLDREGEWRTRCFEGELAAAAPVFARAMQLSFARVAVLGSDRCVVQARPP
jgi:hypothetical protein